jgi:hypothetical protein
VEVLVCVPTDGDAFLAGLVPALTDLDDLPAEVHHAHVFANTLRQRRPVLEAHYDNPWWNAAGTRQQECRADLWTPPSEGEPQIYVEVKLAMLYDKTSKRLGDPRYGLPRGALDWASDVWRLLVGPSHRACCGFLLCVYSNDGSDLFPGWAPIRGPLRPLAPDAIDADRIREELRALAEQTSTVAAIQALARLVEMQLQGRVIRLGGPRVVRTRSDGTFLAADPLLFEWRQEGAQRTADRVDPLDETG